VAGIRGTYGAQGMSGRIPHGNQRAIGPEFRQQGNRGGMTPPSELIDIILQRWPILYPFDGRNSGLMDLPALIVAQLVRLFAEFGPFGVRESEAFWEVRRKQIGLSQDLEDFIQASSARFP
jgi:hypothetical protein